MAGQTSTASIFPNGGTGLYVGNGLNPISPTTGALGIGSINTVGTDATAPANNATLLGANNTFVETYGNTYLVAIQIAFKHLGGPTTRFKSISTRSFKPRHPDRPPIP